MSKLFIYGDNVDTDVIIPARYLTSSDPKQLASHCMEDIDKSFAASVEVGDIIIAGENFGCGSSREHAPIAIKESGISAVIAKSFARIFYRNAINTGLLIITAPDAVDHIRKGDSLTLDLDKGEIINNTDNRIYSIQPMPEFIKKIVAYGGLLKYLKQE